MEQIKLFEDSEVFQKERPIITKTQKEELYLGWAEHCQLKNWINLRHTVDELPEVFKSLNIYEDAYILGKELERRKILNTNFEVCDWLSTLKLDYEFVIYENEKTWFKVHKFKFKFPEQSTIIFKASYRCFNIGDEGKITITNDNGYYLVLNEKSNNVYQIPFEILEDIGEKS